MTLFLGCLCVLSADLRVSGQVTERPPLTVGDLARKVCGSHILSGLPLPASLSNDIQHVWAFEEASVAFQVSNKKQVCVVVLVYVVVVSVGSPVCVACCR